MDNTKLSLKKIQEIKQFQLPKEEPESYKISYSQLSLYAACPSWWHRSYVLKELPYSPSIHTVFGTAMHETIQEWLTTMYTVSVKASNALDLSELLKSKIRKGYVEDREKTGEDFSNSVELQEFYEDGVEILKFLKNHRKTYFSNKGVHLVGVEIPIYHKIGQGMYFKGFLDLVLYDEDLDKFYIYDIKTSTKGWNVEAKQNTLKVAQILLYKEFFSKQFNVDVDKIEVRYFIVKRKIPVDAEFSTQKRRVQEFIPPSGTKKRKQAVALIESFSNNVVIEKGKVQGKQFSTTPSKDTCKYCYFKQNRLCPDAIL